MQKAILSSALVLALTSISASTLASGSDYRWNKGPFSFIKKHFKEFNQLVDIVDELADSQPDAIDINEYHFFDNNLDRHYADQNGHNETGQCDQRVVKHRWDGDNISQEWIDTNSITGQPCGYTLSIGFLPISEGKGLHQTSIALPQIPGYLQSYTPGVQLLKPINRVGESWGGYLSVQDSINGSPLSAPRTFLRTITLLSKLDSVTVPAGTFNDCINVSSKDEATQADGSVDVIAQNISFVCRDIGTVRRVQMVGGYDYQLTSYVNAQ